MKKLVTFRFDPELLDRLRNCAEVENRTLTNFVETVLKRSLEADRADAGGPATKADPAQDRPFGGKAVD